MGLHNLCLTGLPPIKWLSINQLGLTSSLQPNLKRNRHSRQSSTTTTRHNKKLEQNNSSLLINHQRLAVYASFTSNTHTHRKVNQLYNIKFQSSNPREFEIVFVANTEALKSQSIKTHMELKDDISNVSFFFFLDW